MYKNGIKIHSIVFLLIFSKKTCKIINKCITFAPSKDVVLQELHTKNPPFCLYSFIFLTISHGPTRTMFSFAWQMYDRC